MYDMYDAERINTKRQYEFDVLKAFAIFFMITVHVYEELYNFTFTGLSNNVWENILFFLSGPLAAPVFMFSMGVGMVYSKHRSPKELFFRGLEIFGLSYLLNICRFGIPYSITMTIDGVWREEGVVQGLIGLLFNVDILQFAGLAFMATALFKKLKVKPAVMVLIALTMQLVGNHLDIVCDQFNGTVGGYLLGLIFYTGTCVYFPFLNWFIYPALGVLYAKNLKHVSDEDKWYKVIFIGSASLLAIFCLTLVLRGIDLRKFYDLWEEIYYRQDLLYVIFTALVILFVTSCTHFLHKWIHIKPVDNLIKYMSNNLNLIYIIQWMTIGWLEWFILCLFLPDFPLWGHGWLVPIVGIAISAESIGVSLLVNKIRAKRKAKKALKEQPAV